MKPWRGRIVKGIGTWEYVITNDSIYLNPLCHIDHMFRGDTDYQATEEKVVSWGYEGSGPRQLAFSILCHAYYHYDNSHLGWNSMASKYSEAFMKDVVSKWGDEWKIELKEVIEWIKKQEQKDQNETKPAEQTGTKD